MASNKKAQYAIYKGKGGRCGAIQFNLIPWDSNRVRNNKPSPSGFLLLEIAPTIGEENYDWDNKISFALSETDIGQFIMGINGGCEIYHPYNNSHKKLRLDPGDERNGLPTWKFNMSETPDGGQTRNIFIPIAAAEMAVVKQLFLTAIPLMRGWDGKIERWGENDNGVTKALEMLEEVKVILNGLT